MRELEHSYDFEELGECADIHLGEVVAFQFTVVAVVADDIGGSSCDGAVHELIIIRVGSDEIEAIGRIDVLDIGGVGNGLDDKCSVFPVACHVYKNLFVFKENLCTNAQRIAACTESLPDVMAKRARNEYWYEAISVEYDFHLYGVRKCSFAIASSFSGVQPCSSYILADCSSTFLK